MAEALIVIKAALAVGQGLLQIWRSANGKPSKSARQAAGADAKRQLTDILEHIRSLQKETAKINHKDRPALETLKEKLTKWIKKAQELLQKNSLTEEDVRELQQHKIKAFEIVEFQVKIMKELNAQKQPPRVPQINIPNVINIINLTAPTTLNMVQQKNIAGPSAAGASAAGAIESSGRNHIKGESTKPNTTRPGNQRITGQKGKDKEKDKNHSTSDIKGKAASGERKPGDNSKGETNPEKQKSMAHEKGKDREKEKKPGTTGKDKEKEKKPGTTGKDKEKEKKPRTSTGSKGDTHKS